MARERERETIWSGRILSLELIDGRWEVIRHASAVAVLVLDGARVLGVEQERAAIGRRTWELPAGLIDPGESPLEAARRELAEEVQLAGELELITRAFASPGFSDEEVFLFRARGARRARGRPDAEEELVLSWRDVRETWTAVARGELATSAVTAIGLRHALAEAADTPT